MIYTCTGFTAMSEGYHSPDFEPIFPVSDSLCFFRKIEKLSSLRPFYEPCVKKIVIGQIFFQSLTQHQKKCPKKVYTHRNFYDLLWRLGQPKSDLVVTTISQGYQIRFRQPNFCRSFQKFGCLNQIAVWLSPLP